MKKILISMQTVNKKRVLRDMTRDALGSIECNHRWSAQVDDRDVALAVKWNTALDMGISWGVDYLMLVNNDIIFDKQCLDNLIEFHKKNKEYLVVGPTQYFEGQKPEYSQAISDKLHWSFACMNPKRMFDTIGYCETRLKRGSFVDTEWQIRIDKAGEKVARTDSSWFFHWNDTTHRLLPEYKDSFEQNKAIIQEKWGANNEFEHPYNDINLDIKFYGEKAL